MAELVTGQPEPNNLLIHAMRHRRGRYRGKAGRHARYRFEPLGEAAASGK